MKIFNTILGFTLASGLMTACAPVKPPATKPKKELEPEGNSSASKPLPKNGAGQITDGPEKNTLQTTTLMEMEKRDKDGNIVGPSEEGLWFKRGEEKPYSGIVAGHYKGGQMESKRVYENGLQVGTETHWYDNGKKRLELVYMGGAVTSLKQWDPDGNEQGE